MIMDVNTRAIPVDERFMLKTRCECSDDCPLCLSSLKGGTVIILPCQHMFHEKCHARLRGAAGAYRYRCPTCRKDYTRQIQRLKLYEIWGDSLWARYLQYQRGLDGGPAPWKCPSAKRERESFEDWVVSGLSEEELFSLYEEDPDTDSVDTNDDPASPPPPQDLHWLHPDVVRARYAASDDPSAVDMELAQLLIDAGQQTLIPSSSVEPDSPTSDGDDSVLAAVALLVGDMTGSDDESQPDSP